MNDSKITKAIVISAITLMTVTYVYIARINLGCEIELDTQIIAAFNA